MTKFHSEFLVVILLRVSSESARNHSKSTVNAQQLTANLRIASFQSEFTDICGDWS